MRPRPRPRTAVGSLLGAVLTAAGDVEDARAAPGPSPSSTAADCGCCVYVSVRVAARPWGECSGGLVECQTGRVRGPLRLSRRPQPRLDPWQPGWSPFARAARSGPSGWARGCRALPPAAGSAARERSPGRTGGGGGAPWLRRGQGGPATKHQLSGSVSCPPPSRRPPQLGSARPCLISVKTGVVI